MSPDQTAAHSKDRCGHSRARAASAEPYSRCARAVRISQWISANLSLPVHAIHHRSSIRPHDSSRALAPKTSELHAVAEGVGG
jgi:hypothetical protein